MGNSFSFIKTDYCEHFYKVKVRVFKHRNRNLCLLYLHVIVYLFKHGKWSLSVLSWSVLMLYMILFYSSTKLSLARGLRCKGVRVLRGQSKVFGLWNYFFHVFLARKVIWLKVYAYGCSNQPLCEFVIHVGYLIKVSV